MRIRLAFLGSAFEMQECVWECLASLADNLTSTDALTILDDVPRELCGHEAMTGVVAKVVVVLANMLSNFISPDPPTAIERDLKRQAAKALAEALGSVHGFFDDGSCLKYRDNAFYTCLPLKSHVLALSTQAMEALLASDALQVATENEVYTLLGCWVHQSPNGGASDGPDAVTEAKCLPLFRRLIKLVRLQHLSLEIKLVRLQHLSLEYIANVVTPCPLANKSEKLHLILRSSLDTRDADPAEECAHLAPRNRGHGNLVWDCESTFHVADLLTLDKEEYMYKCMGLVDGYPLRFEVAHESRDGKEPSLGMYVFVVMPSWTTQIWEGGVGRRKSLAYTLRVPNGERKKYLRLRYGEVGLGFSDVFGISWDNIFHEKSSYFPDGQLIVGVTIEVVEKGGRAVQTCQ